MTGSWGPRIADWSARELNLKFDPWQEYVAWKAFRHRENLHFVHRTALWSTARQNGKSVIVRAFFGWLFDEGRHLEPFCHWRDMRTAAHDGKQARIIYKALYSDLKSIPRLTKGPPRQHGEEGIRPPIRLSRQIGIETEEGDLFFDILTGEAGAARGLSIGPLAFDEVLTQKDYSMMEAIKPTQMMQVSPILLLTSTAGFAESVVLRDYYDRLRRQAAGDEEPDPAFYGAWWESEDEEAGLDWKAIRQANPSPRIDRSAIASEFRDFATSRDSWRRERLNHFVDVSAPGAFNPGIWAACRAVAPLDGCGGPYSLGIDVQPGWQRATITAAAVRPDGRIGVEVYRDLRADTGGKITAGRVIEEVQKFPEMNMTMEVVYDGISGIAPELRRHAAETAIPYVELGRKEYVAACMDVAELVHAGRLAVDDRLLDVQVGLVARRDVGSDGMFCFSRGLSLGPVDAFLSMTFAAHSAISLLPMPRIT